VKTIVVVDAVVDRDFHHRLVLVPTKQNVDNGPFLIVGGHFIFPFRWD
jgi:hypothetical protein